MAFTNGLNPEIPLQGTATTNPVPAYTATTMLGNEKTAAQIPQIQAQTELAQQQAQLVHWQAENAGMNYDQAQRMIQASAATWGKYAQQGQPAAGGQPAGGQPMSGAQPTAPTNQPPTGGTPPASLALKPGMPGFNPLTYKIPNTPSTPLTPDVTGSKLAQTPVSGSGNPNPFSDDFINTFAHEMAVNGVRADTISNYMMTTMKNRAEIAKTTADAANSNLKFQQNTAQIIQSQMAVDPVGAARQAQEHFGVDITTPPGRAYLDALANSSENASTNASTNLTKLNTALKPLEVQISKENADVSAYGAVTSRLGQLVKANEIPIQAATDIGKATATGVRAAGVVRQTQQVASIDSLVAQIAPYADTNHNIVTSVLPPSLLGQLTTLGINVQSGKINLADIYKIANSKIQQLDATVQSNEQVSGSMGSDIRAKMSAAGAGEFSLTDNNQTIQAKLLLRKQYEQGASDVAGSLLNSSNAQIKMITDGVNQARGAVAPGISAAGQTGSAAGLPNAPKAIDPKQFQIGVNSVAIPKGIKPPTPIMTTNGKLTNPPPQRTMTLADAKAQAAKDGVSLSAYVTAAQKSGWTVK